MDYEAYGEFEGEKEHGLYNGGSAEDWYRCLVDYQEGREMQVRSLEKQAKALKTELAQAREALKHHKAQRKKAESLLAERVGEPDVQSMLALKAERDELQAALDEVKGDLRDMCERFGYTLVDASGEAMA